MPVRQVSPGRLRRRLTIAFALVGGLAAVILAAGSYALVRESRLSDSVDRSVEQARFNLVLAAELLAGEGPPDTDALLAALERRGAFETVGTLPNGSFSSSLSVGADQVPDDVARLVAEGDLAYRRIELAGEPFLLVGGQVAGAEASLYFFFPEAELRADLAQLRNVLLGGTALLLLLAAGAGALVARRTLAPVGRASEAARSLAEGLLETRLPVEREDEFGAWARSFNEMADALEEKIAALSAAQARERQFTADVAHELRTPLTGLVAEASLVREHLERMPPEARRPAELLVEDVGRLRRLVDDLMEISRLDAGSEPVHPEPVDVRALLEASLRSRGWDGRVRIEGEDVAVETDRRRLERILANLVGNAIEHGGGEAVVRVARAKDGARIEVADRGPGIAAEHLPHLFERFYKADPSRTGPGSGLGLAIARENARLLGGEVELESGPGGTRATLTLPVDTVTEPLHGGDPTVSRVPDDRGQSESGGTP